MPDDHTIVFQLKRGTGAALAGAPAMPISVPVPKEYALKYDKQSPSTYGEEHAVYSGPCGWRIIALDTSRPPFDDLNVRKAVIAGFDRVAARQQRGGEALGPVAQHLIPPGMAGFEESNGLDGSKSEMDWLAQPGGRSHVVASLNVRGVQSGHSLTWDWDFTSIR